MSPITLIGSWLNKSAFLLLAGATLISQIAIGIGLALLLARYLSDKLNLNPFGKIVFYLRRPTDRWFHAARSSAIYYPMKQALRIEPVWLILILGLVLFFFLLQNIVGRAADFLSAVSIIFLQFGDGNMVAGIQAIIGVILLGVIYFLMTLVTILVLNSFFGFFPRAASWAGSRIYPLIYSFDRTGQMGPIIFILFVFLLQFAAAAVRSAFF